MEKIKRRDIEKEKPGEFQVCLILPQFVRAEYQEGFFMSTTGSMIYLDVKYWIPIQEIKSMLTY